MAEHLTFSWWGLFWMVRSGEHFVIRDLFREMPRQLRCQQKVLKKCSKNQPIKLQGELVSLFNVESAKSFLSMTLSMRKFTLNIFQNELNLYNN